MRLIRKSLAISSPGATYRLTWTPPRNARVAVIGISVDSLAALRDHQVTGISHGARQALKTCTISSTVYGIPLGHVACRVEHDDLASHVGRAPGFKAWPGRFNSPVDLRRLESKLAQGQGLTPTEQLRLRWRDRVPCRDFTLWPLRELVEFRVDLARLYGSTSILRAWLHLVEFESEAEKQLFCGQPDLSEYPQWIAQALILQSGVGVDAQPHETLWPGDFSGLSPHAVRLRQILATGYSNNSDTIDYAPTYPNNVLVDLRRGDGGALGPSWSEERVTVSELAPQRLQDFDCWRDPEIMLPWFGSLQWNTERLLTSYAKIIRLSLYGTLEVQRADQPIYDVA